MLLTPCPCQKRQHTFKTLATGALWAAEACKRADGSHLREACTLEAQQTHGHRGLIAVSVDPRTSLLEL